MRQLLQPAFQASTTKALLPVIMGVGQQLASALVALAAAQARCTAICMP